MRSAVFPFVPKAPKTGIFSRSSRLVSMAARVAGQEMKHKVRQRVTDSVEKITQSEHATRIAQAKVLADNLSQLKGAAMKAGQLLSMDAGDWIPEEAAEILAKLQGRAEPVDFDLLRKVLEEDIGDEAIARLDNLNPEAAASASIGQVHRATVDGRPVAVKIQYPGIADSIDSDLAVLEKVAASFVTVSRSKVDLSGLFEEMNVILHLEADYEQEAKNLERYRKLLAVDDRFTTPRTFPDLCGRRVLTMTWEEGMSLTDWVSSAPPRDVRQGFAHAVLDLYCLEFFAWGFVQTDPNYANFMIRHADGGPSIDKIVLLDFGATLRYPRPFREQYVELLRTVATQDPQKIIAAGVDFELMDPRESTEAMHNFADMMTCAMEPFEPRMQPFVFRDPSYDERAREVGVRFTRSLKYSPPPRSIIFLHRKLGGIFQLLRKLDVSLDLVPYWERMIGDLPPERIDVETEPSEETVRSSSAPSEIPPLGHPQPAN
ncbi:MAG: AarF/ABC1/UbiB kinase family protein [Myxococcota bacterium]